MVFSLTRNYSASAHVVCCSRKKKKRQTEQPCILMNQLVQSWSVMSRMANACPCSGDGFECISLRLTLLLRWRGKLTATGMKGGSVPPPSVWRMFLFRLLEILHCQSSTQTVHVFKSSSPTDYCSRRLWLNCHCVCKSANGKQSMKEHIEWKKIYIYIFHLTCLCIIFIHNSISFTKNLEY